MDGDLGLAHRSPTRLTAVEGRRFAATVGLAFVALAWVALWRDHRVPSLIASTLGTILALGGLVVPTALGPVSRGWMRVALALSTVTTPILLGLVYFLAIVPVAFAMRLVGRRPLSHGSASAKSVWITRETTAARRSDLTRQF